MRRDAGFTTFVILIAGLGIGASATIFSVVNALLLRPLPFRDPGRLVWIANEEWSTQVSQFLDLRERNKSFSDLAGFAGSWRRRHRTDRNRRAGAPDQRSRYRELLHTAGCATGDRKIVHPRGVPGRDSALHRPRS